MKHRKVDFNSRFEGEFDRFGKLTRESDGRMLDLDKTRLKLDVRRYDDEIMEREVAHIDKSLERKHERQGRKADREEIARVEIEKFCLMMGVFHGFQKD